jgi:hypothetical protein
MAKTTNKNTKETVVTATEKDKALKDATNVETLEKELKEEYKEETAAVEEATKAETVDMSFETQAELLKEYGDTSKKIEELSQETDLNKLQGKIDNELKKAEDIKEQLAKNITSAEKKLNDAQKDIVNNSRANRNFTGFWNGVNYNY